MEVDGHSPDRPPEGPPALVDLAPLAASADGLSISIGTPAGWDTRAEPVPPVGLISLEPEDEAEGFRASMVVSVDELEPGTDLNQWQRAVDLVLEGQMASYLLVDLERLIVAGLPGARRLATYLSPNGTSVTMEQWMVVNRRCGVTVTATAETLLYPAYADFWQVYVQSMRFSETAG